MAKLFVWTSGVKSASLTELEKTVLVFFLNICHKLEGSHVGSLENEFRMDESILKFLVIRLEAEEFERICGQQYSFDGIDKKSDSSSRDANLENDNTEEGDVNELEDEVLAELN